MTHGRQTNRTVAGTNIRLASTWRRDRDHAGTRSTSTTTRSTSTIDDDPYPAWKRLRDEAPLYYNDKYNFYALSR